MNSEQTHLPLGDSQVTGDRFSATVGNEISFAESITALREKHGYTISEAAKITGHRSATFENWSRGHRIPSFEVRMQVYRDLGDPDNPPSAKVLRDMEQLHNLTWDASKRRWKLRITVLTPQQIKKKMVGKRVCRNLKTADAAVAIEIREGIVDVLQKEGFVVKPRIQRRK